MPKVFGIEHILFLIITITIFTTAFIILKKIVKDDKHITIMFRILGGIGLFSILICRISVCIWLHDNNFIYLFPETFCGMTSLLLSISLLFLKKDNFILHMVWLLAIIGMSLSYFYPIYIGDNESVFYPPTITGLWHHALSLFNIIMVLAFGYIKITFKKAWLQLIYLVFFIVAGYILIYAFKVSDAYNLQVPLIKGTILTFYFMMIIYIVIYLIVILIIELIRRKRNIN